MSMKRSSQQLDRLDQLLRTHWRRLLGWFVLVLLPLWGFGEIAEQLLQQEPIPLEVPLMQWLHAHRSPLQDHLAVTLSLLGSAWGMLPAGVLLCLVLSRVRHRLAWFALLSLGGAALLNFAMKLFFARPRPTLWVPTLPEPDSAFPSGHAMLAMALATTVAVVVWPTRWRWPAVGLGALYVLGMLWSRVYIGVHYPSDVVAGALCALVWVLGVARLLAVQRALATHAGSAGRTVPDP